MSSFFCLLRAHVHIGPHLSFTPPLGEACVCAPCSHRDSFELFLLSRGWQQERESATNEDTLDFLVILGLIIPAYLQFSLSPNGMRLSPEPPDMIPK